MDLFNSPAFSAHVEELINKYHIPGLAMAIIHKGVTASKAVGMASFEPPKPMTTDTLFDIASASKSLTAASVALLVADDKYPDVKYEAEMAKLLPGDFVMPGQGYESVTVDDILSHKSGMAPSVIFACLLNSFDLPLRRITAVMIIHIWAPGPRTRMMHSLSHEIFGI
jgi:CubicO group peptidase (beta-lactamase class C family)